MTKDQCYQPYTLPVSSLYMGKILLTVRIKQVLKPQKGISSLHSFKQIKFLHWGLVSIKVNPELGQNKRHGQWNEQIIQKRNIKIVLLDIALRW